jgi:molybdopterin molybdotransferase
MTGAPVPSDADGVVMVERSERIGDEVRLWGPFAAEVRPGLAPRGQDSLRGEPVLHAGTRLLPAQIAILASVGAAEPAVWRRPGVLLVTTGDEIVEPQEKPRPEQIRNSNGALLRAMLEGSGWVRGVRARRAGDRLASLRRTLVPAGEDGPEVFVFTGGVSMGEFDLVPDLLREAGFTIHFHRIALRPGKPILFGTRGRGRTRQAVFGLPGNPVSVCVTAWEFLLPFLRASAGAGEPRPLSIQALAGRAIHRKPGLTHFVAARTSLALGPGATVAPVPYHGSGDFIALGYADCLVRLEPNDPSVGAGEPVAVHPLFREREMIVPMPEDSRRAGEVHAS